MAQEKDSSLNGYVIQSPPLSVSIGSFSNSQELTLVHAGSASTINSCFNARGAKLDFYDYSFEFNKITFSNLDVEKNGLQKKEEERALLAFDRPGLLLIKIKMMYVRIVQAVDQYYLVKSEDSEFASLRDTRYLRMTGKVPQLSLLNPEHIAEKIDQLLNREKKIDSSTPIEKKVIL